MLLVLEVARLLLLLHLRTLRRVVLCTERITHSRSIHRLTLTHKQPGGVSARDQSARARQTARTGVAGMDLGAGVLHGVVPAVHAAEPLLVRPRRVPFPERVGHHIPARDVVETNQTPQLA